MSTRIAVLIGIAIALSIGIAKYAYAGITTATGATQMTSKFAENTNIFPDPINAKSYSIISGHGISPGNQYVIYSPSNSATLTYNFVYLNIAQDNSSDYTDNLCNNMNSDHLGDADKFHLRLELDFTSITGGVDRTFYNKTSGLGTNQYSICASASDNSPPTGNYPINLAVPAGAFSYDADTGYYKAYFTTTISYQWNTSAWQYGYGTNHLDFGLGDGGIRYANQWTVNSTSLLSYGKPGVSSTDPARTVVIAARKGSNSYADANYPFGLSCSEGDNIQKTITLYDFDNHADDSKDVSFTIYKQTGAGAWSPVRLDNVAPDSVYITDPNSSSGVLSADKLTYRPGNGGSSNVTVRVTLQKNTRYYIKLKQFNSIALNYYEIGIPTDGVYGSSNFTCPDWVMTGNTTVTSTWPIGAGNTVVPGQPVTFTHRVAKTGSTSTGTTPIWADTRVSGGAGTNKAGHNLGVFTNNTPIVSDTDTFNIPADATNGKQYCQQVGFAPTAWNIPSLSVGTLTCVTVKYPYTLAPVITASPSAARIGEQVIFTTGVNKNTAYYSNPTDWAIRKIVVPANVTLPPSTRTGTNPSQFSCAYYAGMTCSIVTDGTNRTFTANGTTSIGAGTYTETLNYSVGYNICYAVMIDSASEAAKHNYREDVSCSLVAASPYVSITGGTTWAGGATTSPYTGTAAIRGASPVTFGSFGEYGVFATGQIRYFGSAARLGGTATRVSGTRLTFASEDSLGLFASSHRITDLMARCSSDPTRNDSKTIGPLTLALNTHSIICGDTVTIAGNITYTTAGASTFGQLPSLTVIANTIRVNGSVTQIAGNFYATTKFVTCTEGPQTVGTSAAITTTGACSQPLVVNGAVTVARQTTNSLVLNRSYGGTTTGEPAEVIRMRPEVFLTPLENSFNSASLTTVVETELPARY